MTRRITSAPTVTPAIVPGYIFLGDADEEAASEAVAAAGEDELAIDIWVASVLGEPVTLGVTEGSVSVRPVTGFSDTSDVSIRVDIAIGCADVEA